ncbi:hypothetical protein Lsed01_01085 [Demequina sediminis]|uniref:Septum formation-related domain-containing protein n=1 Tax=Demequina sediminis TaxID=1930058 RepID=A0ABP9WFP4_9MICO|nr:septum formation family protein [Demequina sediminis]BDZ62244.1 hypothetical protein GCM10025873_20350 [Demequina sediminis]
MSDDFAPPPALGTAPVRPTRSAEAAAPASALLDGGAPARPRKRSRRGVVLAWMLGGATALAIAGGVVADVVLEAGARSIEPVQRGATGAVSGMAVVEGLCLEDVPGDGATVGEVMAVPCAEPHRAETIAALTFTEPEWIGAGTIATRSQEFCAGRVALLREEADDAAAGVVDGLAWRVWAPSRETWEAGDRTAVCVVTSAQAWTGSFEAGTASPE